MNCMWMFISFLYIRYILMMEGQNIDTSVLKLNHGFGGHGLCTVYV